MTTSALEAIERDLLDWGLIERNEGGVAWTRRFRASVMREAARLADEERAGRRSPGAPLETAATAALHAYPLPEGAAPQREHARFLYAVELAALPDAVRDIVG